MADDHVQMVYDAYYRVNAYMSKYGIYPDPFIIRGWDRCQAVWPSSDIILLCNADAETVNDFVLDNFQYLTATTKKYTNEVLDYFAVQCHGWLCRTYYRPTYFPST